MTVGQCGNYCTDLLRRITLMAGGLLTLADAAGSQCVMRGACGTDPLTEKPMPCVDNGPPKAVSDKSMEVLKGICPDLVSGQGKEFCCDNDQVTALGTNLEVTQSNKTTRAVLEVNYYMTRRYALGAFSSCSGLDSGTLGALCGSYSDDCGPETLFMGLGMHDGLHSPFQMDFVFSDSPVPSHNHTYKPLNATYKKCSEPGAPGAAPCSCSTCKESCVPSDYPETHRSWKILGISGFTLLAGTVYAIFFVVVVTLYLIARLKNSHTPGGSVNASTTKAYS
nr:NPC intracellular cholesterol transporter 1-like [Rhipicephalus microplus]